MNALSLFSGCGGDTLGLTRAGINVKWYSEIEKNARVSHDLNFKDCKLIGEDITAISDEKFSELKGQVDVIFAGFPCQSFSNGGKKDPSDPRGQLFIEFVRATRLIQPTYIIGENVTGLLTRKTDAGDKFFDIIIQCFAEIGYTCQYHRVKAVEYGVPQLRERLIIIGSKLELPVFVQPKGVPRKNLKGIVRFSMKGTYLVSKEFLDEVGVPDESIVKDLDNVDPADPKPHPYLIRKIEGEKTYKNAEYNILFSFGLRKSPIHCEVVDLTKPTKTIICTYDHQPRLFVAQQNANGYYLRPYLVDELKEIQGFPRDFQLTENSKKQIIQLGNAVPPQIIETVGKWLVRHHTSTES
jgi:DNA (cytosine-5)-methyltransferase 1